MAAAKPKAEVRKHERVQSQTASTPIVTVDTSASNNLMPNVSVNVGMQPRVSRNEVTTQVKRPEIKRT